MEDVENYLKDKLEGKLFVCIDLLKINGDNYSIVKDFYTVRCGKVYMVNDGRFDFTDDKLFDIDRECKCIGRYNPAKIYKRIIKDYSYAQFKKLHKLL